MKWRLHRRKLSVSNGSSRQDSTHKFSVISVLGMEGIRHRGPASESGRRVLKKLEVVRNRKGPVDQAQVQQTLNECVNHSNEVLENQVDAHPENCNYQPPLYIEFLIKHFMPIRCRLCRNSNKMMDPNTRQNAQSHRGR